MVESHRKFILLSDVNKQCRKGYKPYRIWVFNDVLMYGTESHLVGWDHHRTIRLKDVTAVDKLNDKKVQYTFQILSTEKSITLQVF